MENVGVTRYSRIITYFRKYMCTTMIITSPDPPAYSCEEPHTRLVAQEEPDELN
jgi:hypothetical protein